MSTLNPLTQESFRTACGAAGPILLRMEGPEAGDAQERILEQPFAVVGRDPRADLHLDEGGVSRRHAYLQQVDGRWFCVDLLSKQGTHWADGARRSGWLDVSGVQVGAFRLYPPQGTAAEVPGWDPLNDRVPDSAALPSVTLDFLNGDVRQSAWRMSRVLSLVGQAPECKVRLVAPSVSKFHCALVRTRAGAWAVDLLGRQGLRVNGEPARSALLRDGDLLQIGEFVVRLRYHAAGHRLPAHNSGPSAAGSPLVVAESPPVYFLPGERGLADAEVLERLMVPLVNEFRLMQQQMFDQFQQAMTSMFNMFTSMHREQTDLIHQELDRLHKVTQELHTLQAELAKHPPRPAPAAAAPQAASTSPRPAPRPPYKPPHAAPPRPTTPAEGNGPAVPAPPAGATTDEEGAEIHAWLTQRLSTLQRERQSSWQRLMNFMMGKGS